jgi:hypothetical protein
MATMNTLVPPAYCLARVQITGWESVSHTSTSAGSGTGTLMGLCRGTIRSRGQSRNATNSFQRGDNPCLMLRE